MVLGYSAQQSRRVFMKVLDKYLDMNDDEFLEVKRLQVKLKHVI